MPLQLLETRNRDVQVHLHRDVMLGPRRSLQSLDLLKRQLASTARVHEDEPVRVVRNTILRRFIARPVLQSQELPLELGKTPGVGGVDGGVQQLGVLNSDRLQSSHPPDARYRYPLIKHERKADPGGRWLTSSPGQRTSPTTSLRVSRWGDHSKRSADRVSPRSVETSKDRATRALA